MRLFHSAALLLLLVLISACSGLILKPVDYSWPIESVLQVNEKGEITDSRYSLTINVSELLRNEFPGEKMDESISLRVIRDIKGYYYLTGKSFSNIYVFESGAGELSLYKNYSIPGIEKLSEPVFNQRSPLIELIINGEKYMINEEGVVK